MIYIRFPNGKDKALTLSYDDGVRQDIRFLEIINKFGVKCTFNLNGYFVDSNVQREKSIRLSADEARELYCGEAGRGHEVAVHGYTHPWLERIPADMATHEIIKDREVLENMTNRIIRGCAYPYGTYSDEVVDILKKCGIAYARTTVSTLKFDIPTDWLRMPATCHHNNEKLFELADRFLDSQQNQRFPKLFYLWGHTYEFDDNNNWDRIEKFCEKVGNRDDIWYATNIEIYDYVEAYRALKFSSDGKRVYNPSALPVWFTTSFVDRKTVKVEPGETLEI